MLAKITLTVKNGRLKGRKYEFHGPCTCRIGRAADCEIRLPEDAEFATVSRHHCVLSTNSPTVRVQDSGSCNGTYVNGMQIGRPAQWHVPPEIAAMPFRDYHLTDGDELRVGDTVFQLGICVPTADLPEGWPTRNHKAQEACACV